MFLSRSITVCLTGLTTAWGWPNLSDCTTDCGPCVPQSHMHTHIRAHTEIRFSGRWFPINATFLQSLLFLICTGAEDLQQYGYGAVPAIWCVDGDRAKGVWWGVALRTQFVGRDFHNSHGYFKLRSGKARHMLPACPPSLDLSV